MSGGTKQRSRKLFRVDLDGEIGTMPARGLKSVMGLFSHLENVARRMKDETAGELAPRSRGRIGAGMTAGQWPGAGVEEKISFRELGRQVIRAAQCQVRSLQERLEEMQSLVLINDWRTAERMWSRLAPDCKTPLFEVGFVEELWGINGDQLRVGGWTLTRQWQQFVLIQAEVEVLVVKRRSLVELSDVLERELGRWLGKFADLLEKLDEESAA
jgi:hypothetical protein